jgi:hypothetical protein
MLDRNASHAQNRRSPVKAESTHTQVILQVVPRNRRWILEIVGSPIEIPPFENKAEALRHGFSVTRRVRPSLLRLMDQGGQVESEWVYGAEPGRSSGSRLAL